MASGVDTCLRGFGCSTFPHTRVLACLASPSQGKASPPPPKVELSMAGTFGRSILTIDPQVEVG